MGIKVPGVDFVSTSKLSKNRPKVTVYVNDGLSIERVPGVIAEYTEDGEIIEFLWLKSVNRFAMPKNYPRLIDMESQKRAIGWQAGSLTSSEIVGDGTPGDFDLAQSVFDAHPQKEGVDATKQEKFDWTKFIWPALILVVILSGMYMYQDYQKAKLPPAPVVVTK